MINQFTMHMRVNVFYQSWKFMYFILNLSAPFRWQKHKWQYAHGSMAVFPPPFPNDVRVSPSRECQKGSCKLHELFCTFLKEYAIYAYWVWGTQRISCTRYTILRHWTTEMSVFAKRLVFLANLVICGSLVLTENHPEINPASFSPRAWRIAVIISPIRIADPNFGTWSDRRSFFWICGTDCSKTYRRSDPPVPFF